MRAACMGRGVAQLGSALRSGRRGPGFKSRLPDQYDSRSALCHRRERVNRRTSLRRARISARPSTPTNTAHGPESPYDSGQFVGGLLCDERVYERVYQICHSPDHRSPHTSRASDSSPLVAGLLCGECVYQLCHAEVAV